MPEIIFIIILIFMSISVSLSRLLELVYIVTYLTNDVVECNNSFYSTFTYGDTGLTCISQLTQISNS